MDVPRRLCTQAVTGPRVLNEATETEPGMGLKVLHILTGTSIPHAVP